VHIDRYIILMVDSTLDSQVLTTFIDIGEGDKSLECNADQSDSDECDKVQNVVTSPDIEKNTNEEHLNGEQFSTTTKITPEKILPGLKLPRNADGWNEANLYFKIEFMNLPSPNDLGLSEYAKRIQHIIYDYFSSQYGTIAKNCNDQGKTSLCSKYSGMSCKKLKAALKRLKSITDSIVNSKEIRFVSRLIRQSLKKLALDRPHSFNL